MKENIKKSKIFLILFILLINLNCSNLAAQNRNKKQFYDYLDKWAGKRNNFKYLEITLDIDCNNKLLFSISEKNYIYNNREKYQVYQYKSLLILYKIDENLTKKNNINFFGKYLQKKKYNIEALPQGNQSLINSYALYFENNKLITDDAKIHHFMKNNCKNLK